MRICHIDFGPSETYHVVLNLIGAPLWLISPYRAYQIHFLAPRGIFVGRMFFKGILINFPSRCIIPEVRPTNYLYNIISVGTPRRARPHKDLRVYCAHMCQEDSEIDDYLRHLVEGDAGYLSNPWYYVGHVSEAG